MKISISTQETTRPTGNFGTAHQWTHILGDCLGHEVIVSEGFDPAADILVAIHAKRSAEAICSYRRANPAGKIFLALSGTDINPEPCAVALDAMMLADRIILLQDRAILKVPGPERGKAVTILQSASKSEIRNSKFVDPFGICVIGFLRDVKDPMLAARAARLLPASSKIRIRQAGGVLEEKYVREIADETARNPRYRWLGMLDGNELDVLLTASQFMVLSSNHEGGALVLSYALVNHTPVLAAASDCALSVLGESYPGLYPPGKTKALAGLMHRAETDPGFLGEVREITRSLAPRFAPEREIAAWKNLIEQGTIHHSTGYNL